MSNKVRSSAPHHRPWTSTEDRGVGGRRSRDEGKKRRRRVLMRGGGGAEGGVTRLTERERWGPVANLLREYDLIYGGHYSEGQTNGGY